MSFECKNYNAGKCELLGGECLPLRKGCVLVKAGAWMVGAENGKQEEKETQEGEKPKA